MQGQSIPKTRVLVVEDDKALRESIKDVLELKGFDVWPAPNGQIGLDCLSNSKALPDVIILDLMMPIKDGFQFRNEQARHPQWASIPTVILSGDGFFHQRETIEDNAIFLPKPIAAEELFAAIERCTRKNQATQGS